MNPWIILLAAYGAATIWLQNYQPWLVSHLATDSAKPKSPNPPFAVMILRATSRRYGVDGARILGEKPWSCLLCMAFLAALPIWFCSLWVPAQVIVVGFAASGLARILEMAHRYMEVIAG